MFSPPVLFFLALLAGYLMDLWWPAPPSAWRR
jgi:hypothetical protein